MDLSRVSLFFVVVPGVDVLCAVCGAVGIGAGPGLSHKREGIGEQVRTLDWLAMDCVGSRITRLLACAQCCKREIQS